MRLVERFTRLDAETILYRLTVTVSGDVCPRPWSVENGSAEDQTGSRTRVACHEGNYGLANILSAARAEEKK